MRTYNTVRAFFKAFLLIPAIAIQGAIGVLIFTNRRYIRFVDRMVGNEF